MTPFIFGFHATGAAAVPARPAGGSGCALVARQRSLLSELMRGAPPQAPHYFDNEIYSDSECSEGECFAADEALGGARAQPEQGASPLPLQRSAPVDAPPTPKSKPVTIPYPSPTTWRAWQRTRQYLSEQALRQQATLQVQAAQMGYAPGAAAAVPAHSARR